MVKTKNGHRPPTRTREIVKNRPRFDHWKKFGFLTIHNTWSKGLLLWSNSQWSKKTSIRLQTAVSPHTLQDEIAEGQLAVSRTQV